PLGIEGAPIRVSPGNVRVQIPVAQQLSYKTVGIQPTVVGIPQPGHIIEGVTVEPPAITIVGSPQALAAVNFATTERVDTTDATSTFARQVSVLVPEGVSLVQEGVSRVTVRLNALDLAQSVFAIPLAENLDPGLMITSALPTVQIVIRGAPLALQALQGSDVRVTLPLGGLGDGSHQVELAAAAPLGISVQSMSPRVVAVTLATSATSSPSSPVPAPSPGLPGTPGATPAGATPEGGSP
ncbi:MAG TPA: CdaR family protein, partial [Rhodothermia bacterium]|nr:CdaR family protein [Rhodothermia bacterium]